MKSLRHLLFVSLALLLPAAALSAKPIPGPKGGRIVTTAAPHIELFVSPDHTAVVSFYDAELKPVAPGAQLVTAVAEAPSGKVTLAFAAKDGALVSTAPLPEGEGYRIVLQVRDDAQARPKNYRVEFHAEKCGSCQLAEYACVCEH